MTRCCQPCSRALGLVLFGQGAYIHASTAGAGAAGARLYRDHRQRSRHETVVMGRHLAGGAHRGEAAADLRHRAGRQQRPGAGLRPGHVELTPDAGERGVAVYSAHRDTHFRFLKNVVIGDEIAVTRGDGRTFRYRADRTSVVRFDARASIP